MVLDLVQFATGMLYLCLPLRSRRVVQKVLHWIEALFLPFLPGRDRYRFLLGACPQIKWTIVPWRRLEFRLSQCSYWQDSRWMVPSNVTTFRQHGSIPT